MKKLLGFVFAALLLLSYPACAEAYNGATTVYVTRTGTKYHRASCSYLKSSIEMTLEEAVAAGYEGCSRCKPPSLSASAEIDNRPYQSSGSSGGTSTSRAAKSLPTPKPTTKPAQAAASAIPTQDKETSPFAYIALGAGATYIGSAVIKGQKKKALDAKQRQEEKEKYTALYAGKSLAECCGMPLGCGVGEDGLPYGRGRGKWGDTYTFYVTPGGAAFHKERGCYGAKQVVNVCNLARYRPCSRCRPQAADISWYKKYKEIKTIKEKYGID